MPPPHVLVHKLHDVHCDTSQCTGQLPWLHARTADSGVHAAPPFAGSSFVERVRVWLPEPQEAEQAVHAVQGVCTQSTGHLNALQARSSDVAEHFLPPCATSRLTARLRDCTPLPHERLHDSQEPQSLRSQSTAQSKVLQSRRSESAPHGLPPCSLSTLTPRLRRWVPLPHVRVHVSHLVQADCTQSTGHAWPLHVAASLR